MVIYFLSRSKNKLFPILIIGPNNIESQTEAYNLGVNIYHSQPIICSLLKAQIGQLTRFFNERIFFQEDNIIIDVGTRMINIDGMVCRLMQLMKNVLRQLN